MSWFRVHNDILENPKLILIAESDRWRFMGLLSLKSQGVLEQYEGDKLDRVIAAKLRLTPSEWEETKRRLQDESLIDEKYKPVGWDDRQFKTDSSAERTRKYRERKKKKVRDATVTSQRRHSDGTGDAEVTPPDNRVQSTEIESPNGDSCAEPSGSAPAASPGSPRVVSLPTNRHKTAGELFHVTQAMVDEWRELYPAVDVMQQLRNMIGWSAGNPAKRKTLSGMPKFVNAWLAREQNKGSGVPATTAAEACGSPGRSSTRSQSLESDLTDTSWANGD